MSFEERRLSNDSIGFSTISPSLDRHLWAARYGYAAGPEMVRLVPGLVRMSEWLATLDIGVVVPTFWVCSGFDPMDDVGQDCKMLKSIVDDVLSGVLTEGLIRTRFPQFGVVLFAVILTDLALLWRS